MVAALYVETGGVYYGLDNVDPWDEQRDARSYAGPWPVVAHPPCARWSRFAGFTEARFGLKRGDDGGCFEAALHAVRTYGGVLEHPAYTDAFSHFGLPKPSLRQGWTLDLFGGASCYIEQGRYGLPVKKATWLYAHGVQLPELRWGFTPDGEGPTPNGPYGGMHAWRDAWTRFATSDHKFERAFQGPGGKANRSRTPVEFRDALIAMAESANRAVAA